MLQVAYSEDYWLWISTQQEKLARVCNELMQNAGNMSLADVTDIGEMANLPNREKQNPSSARD